MCTADCGRRQNPAAEAEWLEQRATLVSVPGADRSSRSRMAAAPTMATRATRARTTLATSPATDDGDDEIRGLTVEKQAKLGHAKVAWNRSTAADGQTEGSELPRASQEKLSEKLCELQLHSWRKRRKGNVSRSEAKRSEAARHVAAAALAVHRAVRGCYRQRESSRSRRPRCGSRRTDGQKGGVSK